MTDFFSIIVSVLSKSGSIPETEIVDGKNTMHSSLILLGETAISIENFIIFYNSHT